MFEKVPCVDENFLNNSRSLNWAEIEFREIRRKPFSQLAEHEMSCSVEGA